MKRKILTTMIILSVCLASVFAMNKATMLYEKVTQEALQGNVAEAIGAYEDLKAEVKRESKRALEDMISAMKAYDMQKYYNAYSELNTLEGYYLTLQDTQLLLNAIVKQDDTIRTGNAQWLYTNSMYYKPTLTFDYSTISDGRRFTYRSRITAMPGSEILLPGTKTTLQTQSVTAKLIGWGTTPTTTEYTPGQAISMPLTSQTLYARWENFISFTDSVTGLHETVENITKGKVITLPRLKAPSHDYYFKGWLDTATGTLIAPTAETYTTTDNSGASFIAIWNNIGNTAIYVAEFEVDAVPTNRVLTIGYDLINRGTANMENITVSISSASSAVTITNPTMQIKTLLLDQTMIPYGLKLMIQSGTPSGTRIPLTLTVTDSDGDSWKYLYTMKVK